MPGNVVMQRSASSKEPTTAPTRLRAQVVALGVRWSNAQYRLVHLVVELDRSAEWTLDGSRTCAHWVASALDVEVCTAREWLRIGRALERLPVVDAAFAAGHMSYGKVRLVTRVADPETEEELVSISRRTPAGLLAREIARWQASREEPEETEARQREARSLTWRTEPDGMIVGTWRLPPPQRPSRWRPSTPGSCAKRIGMTRSRRALKTRPRTRPGHSP